MPFAPASLDKARLSTGFARASSNLVADVKFFFVFYLTFCKIDIRVVLFLLSL